MQERHHRRVVPKARGVRADILSLAQAIRRAFGERLKELEKQNSRLKRLLAERDVEIDVMKDLLSKNW